MFRQNHPGRFTGQVFQPPFANPLICIQPLKFFRGRTKERNGKTAQGPEGGNTTTARSGGVYIRTMDREAVPGSSLSSWRAINQAMVS